MEVERIATRAIPGLNEVPAPVLSRMAKGKPELAFTIVPRTVLVSGVLTPLPAETFEIFGVGGDVETHDQGSEGPSVLYMGIKTPTGRLRRVVSAFGSNRDAAMYALGANYNVPLLREMFPNGQEAYRKDQGRVIEEMVVDG